MLQRKLSIIIPYNNEPKELIMRNLIMIDMQLYCDWINYEVIIVQDSDESQITQNDMMSFQNIHPIYLDTKQPKHVGPGMTRQFGIDISNGEYIMFIDADDQLENPLVFFEFETEMYPQHQDLYLTEWYEMQYIDDKPEIFFHKSKMPWLHGQIYRKEFLQQYNITFHPELKIHEDLYFNRLVYQYLDESKATGYNFPTYIWNANQSSITRQNNHEYRFKGESAFIRAIDLSLERDAEDNRTVTFPILEQVRYFYEKYMSKKFIEECPKEDMTHICDMLSYFFNKWNDQIKLRKDSKYYHWYKQILDLNITDLPPYQSYI